MRRLRCIRDLVGEIRQVTFGLRAEHLHDRRREFGVLATFEGLGDRGGHAVQARHASDGRSDAGVRFDAAVGHTVHEGFEHPKVDRKRSGPLRS